MDAIIAAEILEKAITAERDIQTINQNMCKCGRPAHIAENLFRTRYRVACYGCHESSGWFAKIDDAVKEWNKNNPENL